jgi:hypothetical protein
MLQKVLGGAGMRKYQGAIVLAIILFTVQGGNEIAFSETVSETVVSPAMTGFVTGVSANEIQIDGYSYRIKVGAEILDPEGEPLMDSEGEPFPVAKIRLGSSVKYFIKAGEIQKMIVTFPQ